MDAPDEPRANASTSESFYATKPTGFTVFLRTFLPLQVWRFIDINLRMFRVIARSHEGHH